MWWKLWRRHWQGLLIEMLAVFIGVSAAFALDSYREGAEKSERREQIVRLLLNDVNFIEKSLDDGLKRAESSEYIGLFLSRYANDEQPAIRFFLIPDYDRTQVWLSLLQSGGGDVISVNTLSDLERIILLTGQSRSHAGVFNQLMHSQIMANIEQPNDYFYDTNSKKLRKPFDWLPYYLKQMIENNKALQSELVKLKVSLELELNK